MVEHLYDSLLESVIVIDRDLNITYCNESFSTLIDIPVKRILRQKELNKSVQIHFEPLLSPDKLELIQESTAYQEVLFNSISGKSGKVQISIQPFVKIPNQKDHWIIYIHDVTLEEKLHSKYRNELSKKEELIFELEFKLFETSLFYGMSEAIHKSNDRAIVIFSLLKLFTESFSANKAHAVIFDSSEQVLIYGSDAEHAVQFESVDLNALALKQVIEGPVKNFSLKDFLVKNINLNPEDQIIAFPITSKNENMGNLIIVNSQIALAQNAHKTELLDRIAKQLGLVFDNFILYEKSIRDGLTSLFNHRHMKNVLGKELKRTRRTRFPISFLLMDIDFFKKFNDNYGHQVGDMVLKAVGGIILKCCRETDVACRYGGEEFAIILPETPPNGANILAERIRKTVENFEFTTAQFGKLKITISIGISSFPDLALTLEELIKTADVALYDAKHAGRNRCKLYSSQDQSLG